MVVVIVIVTVIVMLSVLVRLLIQVIVSLPFDCYIDITNYSTVSGAGNCIIHNRSRNHVNNDSD